MAPNSENEPPNPNQKTLHVWSKPVEQKDEAQSSTGQLQQDGSGTPNTRPTITDAVSMIKKEDFANVASTPCARQGFLTGIASGAGLGGLKFVLQGNATKSANWAVGIFVLGSVASYEYCQYQRRSERIQMKRHIEVVTQNKREQARKAAEDKREQLRLEQEQKASQRPWYKPW
ncbi:Cytochrome c oxidase protein 20, mitochondrial [Tolypocladium ophioglossoides CBS 100239]|uniref:Cytochrome c oxidase assembly protein COX20, mitochondrial n=1 Tax=Tolypocladium ophioglossoides (strain CBS 100239) TaxID=1163406 RepID=A0A0L0N658_TOLOC|nr:Cytochrome c oxidase protein 20, mitochondrial [Tolypocladium ophioglossoides CBS 100239]